jgi:hypothetical protein
MRERIRFVTSISYLCQQINAKGKKALFLIPKHEKIKPLLVKEGLNPDVPKDAIRHFLPDVYNTLSGSVDVKFVSAINQTKTLNEEGKAIEIPQKSFTSSGLEDVMNWFVEALTKTKNEQREKKIVETMLGIGKKGVLLAIIWIASLFLCNFIGSCFAPFRKAVLLPEKTLQYALIPKGHWGCDVKETMMGADDIVFFNKSDYELIDVAIEVAPNNGDKFQRSFQGQLAAGGIHTWTRTYNFKNRGIRGTVAWAKYMLPEEENIKENRRRLKFIALLITIPLFFVISPKVRNLFS